MMHRLLRICNNVFCIIYDGLEGFTPSYMCLQTMFALLRSDSNHYNTSVTVA